MDKSHLLQHRRLPGRSSPQQEDLDFARETLLVLWMSESDVRQQCCCAPTSWSALSICLLRLVSSSLGFEKQLPMMEDLWRRSCGVGGSIEQIGGGTQSVE